jgi:hypothetical protein
MPVTVATPVAVATVATDVFADVAVNRRADWWPTTMLAIVPAGSDSVAGDTVIAAVTVTVSTTVAAPASRTKTTVRPALLPCTVTVAVVAPALAADAVAIAGLRDSTSTVPVAPPIRTTALAPALTVTPAGVAVSADAASGANTPAQRHSTAAMTPAARDPKTLVGLLIAVTLAGAPLALRPGPGLRARPAVTIIVAAADDASTRVRIAVL